MKRIKLLIVIVLFPFLSYSQGVEIIPFMGYMFGGSIDFVEGKLNISDGLNYGVSVLVPVHRHIDVEINYTRMVGMAEFNPSTGYDMQPWNLDAEEADLNTNYFQLGIIGAISRNNPGIIPFGSFSMGATLFSIDKFSDTWRFSVTAGLGVKFIFSDHIGVMLRGRLMLPMAFGNDGEFCGVGTGGSGCGLTTSGFTAILQADINAGLIIKLGH